MKKIKLMCLFIAIFGLASTGTVLADKGKHYYGGGKHYYGGGKHIKHYKHHKRHYGRGYYSGRGYYGRGFYRGYGGYSFRIGFGGNFPGYYVYPPVVVVPQAPPIYIQQW